MRQGAILSAAALVIALGWTMPAVQAAEKKPWDIVKELIQKPFKQAEERLRQPKAKDRLRDPKTRPDGTGENPPAAIEDSAGKPDLAAIPVPRPRPQHAGARTPTPDFEASFIPPPVLKVPSDVRAPEQPQPTAAEPELIPLGPPGAGDGRQAAFPFPIPRQKPERPQIEPLAMLPEEPPPSLGSERAMPGIGSCTTDLAALGVDASPLAPIAEGSCTVAVPTSVTSFENGRVKLPIKALVNCEMAKTAARWLEDAVQPAATSSLGGRVTALRVAGSYDCRTRDHIPGAKLSEHAFGNAIDFSAFQVGGRWIEVGGSHPDAEQRFIDAIRAEACGPFKTVLGPGSDSYHADHLHLDLAKRRTAGPSKGLYCK